MFSCFKKLRQYLKTKKKIVLKNLFKFFKFDYEFKHFFKIGETINEKLLVNKHKF